MSVPRKYAVIALVAACALSAYLAVVGPAGPGRPARGLVILVEFPDMPGTVEHSEVVGKFRKLAEYVQESSYGRARLEFEVTGRWYRVPRPLAHYRIPAANFSVSSGPVFALTDDVLNEAERDIDLSGYDFIYYYLSADTRSYGMASLFAYPGVFGWKRDSPPVTRGGRTVDIPVAIDCRNAHLGSLVHNIAHILGGWRGDKRILPCLYDQHQQARSSGAPREVRMKFLKAIFNMGFWDPMSCHFYRFLLPPPGMSSWSRMRLGWLDPGKVRVVKPGASVKLLLGPLEDGRSDTLAIKLPLSDTSYYLIENRQRIGYDRFLPGEGVLILRADDTVGECLDGKSPVRLVDADPSRPYLTGAAFDIGRKDSYTDEKAGFRLKLLEKRGASYLISIEPAARPER